MKTIKFLFAAVILAFSSFSFAATAVDISKLPKEQQAAILESIGATATVKAEAEKPSAVVSSSAALRGETEKWADVIVGAAVSGAQKANMVVNEFSQTTVGKVTIAIVAYKLIGKDAVELVHRVIRYISGFVVVVIGLIVGYVFWLKTCRMRVTETKRELQPVFFGFTTRLVTTEVKRSVTGDNDWMPGIFISVLVGIIGGAIIAFA